MLAIGTTMSPSVIFNLHLLLGYAAWLPCVAAYVWPRLRAMPSIDAQRAIATLHSFRFFGLVFILPGIIGSGLPQGFGVFAAYGDFATGLLAMLALFLFRSRALFWALVIAFDVVGLADLVGDYYLGATRNLAAVSGQLGPTYYIVMIYVPILMITHFISLYLLVRPRSNADSASRSQLAAN